MAAAIEQFQKSETSPTGRPSGDAEHNVSRFDTAELMARVRALAQFPEELPAIYSRAKPSSASLQAVYGWQDLRRRRELELLSAYGGSAMQPSTFVPTTQLPLVHSPSTLHSNDAIERPTTSLPRQVSGMLGKTSKHHKAKGNSNGRTYTSKFRGVHQTFPTKRWEAQFRRNGKPTSLGCFDAEEEAARAYDKMMLWCELHHATGVKGGITNFDHSDYEQDVSWLLNITQDDLVQLLRSDGRQQAQRRTMRQKRDQVLYSGAGASGDDD
ncbi:AP2-like ethylene-responsive transcription factor SNZ [Auxenochlorella protothecoides]|uniref:AP2-like ethylene-responsive transcription factor SNZ n=1 Tax=Auxenochlorella protothecoides TaxID=3075 RepID=A0A087SU45_AUXPR|nr:AP2-like ethylene-responsive transcription factor SNZ [Auxenochlorella protothecoides]KFM29249.1 AP2-like ethylene-responsive transcription factor SNZ [Auxenochlorella protothecoides]RMZ55963.1 hypothetical protein APUTEX25_004387 [Auxenochlorella protothecoides]|eukprot:RMZ55963.1 hypothetical protein APUTEX25_004387 [Auxenochlorella protothecoides]